MARFRPCIERGCSAVEIRHGNECWRLKRMQYSAERVVAKLEPAG